MLFSAGVDDTDGWASVVVLFSAGVDDTDGWASVVVLFSAGVDDTDGWGRFLGMTVSVNVWKITGGVCIIHRYRPACCSWRAGIRRDPLPRSCSPDSVAAGATGMEVDWNNQITWGTGLPEATQ